MNGKPQRVRSWCKRVLAAVASLGVLAGLMAPVAARAEPVKLPGYGADLTQTSVSGLSAGAYMAVQMHIVHSSIMKGVGVFAGGPYHCAESDIDTALKRCMQPTAQVPPPSASDIDRFAQLTRERAANGLIDDPANLASQKAWIFVGTSDDIVRPSVVDTLPAYYRNFMPPENIVYRSHVPTFHNQVVLEGDSRVRPCNYKNNPFLHDPYVNDCDYDAAGELLQHIYGPLAPRSSGALGGSFLEYDQGEFVADPRSAGLDDTGWAYVPASCAAGARCRVHVAFHGCFQQAEYVGDAYVRNSGLNQWADTNGIIVLYPQTVPSPGNPNGCFDWWGYTAKSTYDTRDGVQIAAVRRMIDRVAGATTPPPPVGANERQFASVATEDGYVKAGAGGGAAEVGIFSSLAIGRGTDRKLNRAVLSFDTSAIPAGATVTRAFLTIAHHWTYGRPWDSAGAGPMTIDVKSGVFGTSAATQTDDWGAPPTAAAAASVPPFAGGSQRSAEFNAAGLAAINKGSGARTQLRLQFSDGQRTPGYVRIREGAGATLTVEYRL